MINLIIVAKEIIAAAYTANNKITAPDTIEQHQQQKLNYNFLLYCSSGF